MKTNIKYAAAMFFAVLIMLICTVYAAFAAAVMWKQKNGGGTLELVTGLPGMRDTVVATVDDIGVDGGIPAGSHVEAALRVQYRVGGRYFWADEVTGALDIDDGGQTGDLVLSQRQHNVNYAELLITVTSEDGETQTYTVTEVR